MNSNTGDIRRFESEELARKAGYDVPLTDAEAAKLAPIMPQDRPARLKKIREKYPGQSTAYLQGAWQGS